MKIQKTRDGASVRLPMDSWYGGRRRNQVYGFRELGFPTPWDVTLFEPDGLAGAQILSADEVRAGVHQAIGTADLRKLAESRRSAAIIVDDMSRPTPAYAVVPIILEELDAAGIRPRNTRIVIAQGTHRPITKAEQRRKLGREVVDRVEVINHNAFTRKTKAYRHPDGGPDIVINRAVGDADLKISLSGVVSHGGAGFGGGAKALLPGVASYATIQYNHRTFAWEDYGTLYPAEIQSACIRRDIERSARAVGLDYSINLVCTPLKEIVGVFSGDFVAAHRAAAQLAHRLYLTRVPEGELDIVVTNGYPLDTDVGQTHRGAWPEKYGKRSVLTGGTRDGWAYHGDNGKSWRVYQQMRKEKKPLDAYRFKGTRDAAGDDTFYYSPNLTPEAFYERKSPRRFQNRWEELVAELGDGRRARTVGIFPYATIQVEGKQG
ncbi:MAG: lactate racemase domain-containing protein [Candidatus Latescibacteria bacterium]|jgi:hypothetical protein|nr:lactate racemase domain-containing protein [Candidatus Latescibacterota bacterium]